MNIVILMGSPNRKGSTAILVEHFVNGAEEAGHSCEVLDVCHADIRPCTGCVRCGYEGPCVQKDDMAHIRAKLLNCDMVVFATPLYYYGMSAQLKTVVDRFCAFNSSLNSRRLKSALLAVAWNADDWTWLEATLQFRRPDHPLQAPCALHPLPGRRQGAGLRLRHAVHDQAQRIPGGGVQAGKRTLRQEVD